MRRTTAALTATLAAFGLAFAQEGSVQDAAAPPERQGPPPVGTAVAAIVNDSPISTFDVQQRLRLLMVSAGAQLNEQALVQMQRQALRDLIEEQLKLQEAESFELTIPDEEVDAEIVRIATEGGSTPDQLVADLAQQGISVSTLRDRIRADLAWERIVSGRYGGRVSVSDDEVDDQMTALRAEAQSDQYLVSEICLPLDDPSQAEQLRNVGLQMIEQMRQGVPFRALASQFSACPSAARGGDLGWMRLAEMRPAVRELVPQLGEGNVSLPIPDDGMLTMIALRGQRAAAEAGEPAYEVTYAGADKSVGRVAAAEAFARLRATGACDSPSLSVDLGPGIGVTALPMLPAETFAPQFRGVLAGMERGDVSDLIEGDTAYHAVMLCQKDEGLGLPSRQQVTSRLRAQALDRIARRYLRDIERDSAVEVRLTADG